MTDQGLYSALFAAHEGSDRTFLELDDGSLSYGDFLALAARQATVLADAGVAPGDRVAVQVAKTPEALALVAACARIGAAVLPLNTSYTPAELEYFVTDAAPAVLVCDPSSEAALTPIAVSVSAKLVTLDAEGAGSLSDAAASAAPMAAVAKRRGDDLAAILYTSGPTGRSKGAMLTNDNLLSNALTLRDLWQFTSEDHLIHALPIFHTHGLFVAVNVAVSAGCSMRFMAKFDPDKVFAAMPNATSMMGVPTFYTRLLADPRLTREATAGIRLFISGSAPLLAETHVEFEARTGQRILERYGMTETNMNTSNPFDGERRAGTVGMPLPGVEVHVTDPATGEALPQGARGMIEVRGDNVFS
ncbi:MAG: AMP-binding protein, partial [Pseudomonadota bacterium]